MSAQGQYDVQVKTRVGLQHGSLSLVADGSSLSGVLGIEKGSSELAGTITGNEVSFTAKIKTPIGRMTAHVTGVIDGDTFRAPRSCRWASPTSRASGSDEDGRRQRR
jgi:hypothetical protein